MLGSILEQFSHPKPANVHDGLYEKLTRHIWIVPPPLGESMDTVVLGNGKHSFESGSERNSLELVDSTMSEMSVIKLTYRPKNGDHSI